MGCELDGLRGVQMVTLERRLHLQLTTEFAPASFPVLVTALRESETEFEVYDPLYGAPGEDAGAYICYSREKAWSARTWSMTLGNQGWSGGIYQIAEDTIVLQLRSLLSRGLLRPIQITGTTFFSHYTAKDEAANLEKDAYLRRIHSVAPGAGPSP